MAYIKSLISLCIAFLFLSFNAFSSHLIGADITYKCTTTPGVFEVTLVVFRDCAGIAICTGGNCSSPCTTGTGDLPDIIFESAQAGCSFAPVPIRLNLVNVRDVAHPAPQCPNTKNQCTNRGCATPGVYAPSAERYEFKGTINLGSSSGLPANCCNVRLSWSVCCRNPLNNAQSGNFYTDAIINRCLVVSPCNSSPVFTNDPKLNICGGENFIFNNGAHDPDGDSLSYSFSPALQAFGIPLTYNAPYSPNRPMPWTGAPDASFPAGISCNPKTGDIMFTPTNSSDVDWTGAMAIEVKQWETINGIPTIIGITRRDIQLTLLGAFKCPPNNVPNLKILSSNTNNLDKSMVNWEVYAGQQLCFTIIAKDTDFRLPTLSDTTFLSWNNQLAAYGATFLPTYDTTKRRMPAPPLGNGMGPREDSYQFCWTPDSLMARPHPYFFSVKANDLRCTIAGNVSQGFLVKVYQAPNVSISKTKKTCNTYELGYMVQSPNAIPILPTWEIAKEPFDYTFANGKDSLSYHVSNPNFSFTKPGKYLLKLTLRTASLVNMKTMYDTITVDTILRPIPPTVSAMPTNLACPTGNNGKISMTVVTQQGPLLFSLNNTSYRASQLFDSLPASNYTVYIKDTANCVYTRYASLSAPLPIKSIVYTSSATCYGRNDGRIEVIITRGRSPFTFSIDSIRYQSNNFFDSLLAGNYRIYVKDSASCVTVFDTLASIYEPSKIAVRAITGSSSVALGSTHTYLITPQPDYSTLWGTHFGAMLSSNVNKSAITIKWDTAGTGMVYAVVYSDTTCGDTASLSINIGPNSLNEIAKQWGLAMHPNPTRDVVNITVKQLPENASIRITDIHGRILLSVPLQYQQQIDMNPWPQGTYFINIGEWNGKLMKW
jgi:PKD repeat protein